MRGRKSSGYYRQNRYKKRKIRNILIISAVCLVVLFLLFVISGNLLGKKVETQKSNRDKAQTTDATPTDTATYSIEAYPVDISSGSDVAAQIKALSGNGVRAVSIHLTDPDGKLLIRSDLAVSLGYQGRAEDVGDFSSVISRAKYYDMFTSALLDLQFLSEKDAKQRAVRMAYEAALAAEVSEAGASEVVFRAPSADATQTELLVDFANNVKSINDTVVIGILLPREFFYQDSSAENIAKLTECFDVIGIDVSELPDEANDVPQYIENVFAESNLKYYVLRYNMRVLLPSISDEQSADLTDVLEENSIENWQKIS